MRSLDDLYKRRKKLADVLADEEYSGIRKIVEELYPDRAHFIYELLQNAEDAGAREAQFTLEESRLVFEHDGRPFDYEDVEGITNIGKGTKSEQRDKIGQFGIGFKAVFAYSETPHIWSPTYSFKITDLVLPLEIPGNSQIGQKTRFEFPFDSHKKSAEDAYVEIEIGLDELAKTTLLFLSSLESICWQIGRDAAGEVLRIEHSEHHIEVLKQSDGKAVSSAHFLCFFNAVEGLKSQSVAIAFELDFLPNITSFEDKKSVSSQMKIIPSKEGRVAVFFPAEKETSGLRFHLHAPFVPELSRASIKETPANTPLLEQLAQLTASSLHVVRNLKLLTGDFLGVLPNPQDTIPRRYIPIRDAIINEMNNEQLTPTYAKSHAPATQLLQAKASLKNLLSEKDLRRLIEYDNKPPQWAIGASQKNSLQDRFLSSLSITKWDIEDFVDLLEEKASNNDYSRRVQEPDEEFIAWISGKPVAWHQQMYALLYTDFLIGSSWEKEYSIERLKKLRIVRLSNGNYSDGSKCFFPSNGVESEEVMPRVSKGIFYSSGKSKTQQENARKLLEKIGVREVGEAELVEAILRQRYSPEAVKRKGFKPDRKDIERFIALVEKEQACAELFAGYYIFERADGKWGMPSQVYLDSPFFDTGLSDYYEALGKEAQRYALAKSYEHNNKIAAFAKAVGAHTCLVFEETNCSDNPQYHFLRGVSGTRYTSPIDCDYVIPKLQELLQKPTIKLSKLVWRTMSSLPSYPNYLRAQYRKNWSNGSRVASSQIVHHLRNVAWVPQQNGVFVRPMEASRELLPEGFPFDAGQKWLEEIQFGMSAKKRSEKYEVRNHQALKMGFESAEEAAKALKIAELCRQTRRPLDDLIAQFTLNVKKKNPEFPERAPSNPGRRRKKLEEQMGDAPKKEYGQRDRNIRTTRGTIDPAVWLRNQYKNEDDQMVCQVCKEEMPFRKRDGEHYFESVESLSRDHFTKEHEAQFLALCPLCAAMYNEFVKQDEEAMLNIKNALMNSEGFEIPLRLGELDTSIRFVETHYHAIKTIIEISIQDNS